MFSIAKKLIQRTNILQFLHHNSTSAASKTFKPSKVDAKITAGGTHVLSVLWNNEREEQYPAVWLRDNCQCSECYQASALGRLHLMKNVETDINFEKLTIKNNVISINWPDGHESMFKPEFFIKYGPNGTSGDFNGYAAETNQKIFWHGDYDISKHNFEAIVNDNKALLDYLEALYMYGIALVQNVPRNLDGLPKLIKSVFNPEPNHYGSYYVVEQKENANNIAYTGADIGLHQDLPFYEKTMGVQFLHCIEQFDGIGGDNEFVDSFAIGNHIKENHPVEWENLTSVKVTFSDLGYDELVNTSFYKVHSIPMFTLNDSGNIVKTCYNNQVRSRIMISNPDETKAHYEAQKLFNNLAYSKKFLLEYKLKNGECITFDNHRILHGRKGFEPTPGSSRLYHGSYMAWDEVRSRMNVIKYMENEQSPH